MLRAIFYSEFDNRVGPVLTVQEPDGYLSSDVFDGVSDYIITKPQLVGKLVTITTSGHRIMGYPLRVEHSKYHRNALMFNAGLVFDAGSDTVQYETVLSKLGNTLHTMETETSFLSDPVKKESLRSLLPKIREGLLECGEVVLPVGGTHTLALSVFNRMTAPPTVEAHHVPVAVRTISPMLIKGWDLCLQRVVGHIDGVNSAARIAALTRIDLGLVRHALRQLLHFGYIRTIDIFQYSNVYATTPELTLLNRRSGLLQRCIKYITRTRGPPPAGTSVFRLYSQFKSGMVVGDLCRTHRLRDKYHIDDRRFVAFGVMHGLIRRLHEYPVPIVPLHQLQPARGRLMDGGEVGEVGEVGLSGSADAGVGDGGGYSYETGSGGGGGGGDGPGGAGGGGVRGGMGSRGKREEDAGSGRSGRTGGGHGATAGAGGGDSASKSGGAGVSAAAASGLGGAGAGAAGAGGGGGGDVRPMSGMSPKLLQLCDGRHCFDEICSILVLSRGELRLSVECHPKFVIVMK